MICRRGVIYFYLFHRGSSNDMKILGLRDSEAPSRFDLRKDGEAKA